MADLEYTRHHDHDRHQHDPIFAAAEVLAVALLVSADRIASALEGSASTQEPKWAKRMESEMADLATAISNLQAVDQSVVDELQKLANEIANAPNVSAAADLVQAEADRLQQAVAGAEPAPPAPAPDQPPA